jgi:hypothetical protein
MATVRCERCLGVGYPHGEKCGLCGGTGRIDVPKKEGALDERFMPDLANMPRPDELGGEAEEIVVYADESRSRERCRFPMPRQRQDVAVALSLADFVAPRASGLPDFIGGFAVTTGHGTDELVAEFDRQHDDYQAIMSKEPEAGKEPEK